MGRSRFVGLLMIAFTGGCVPSKEAKTAGQIGCTPQEIAISNEESHFGLIQSGNTWVAECRGREFVCSQVNQSGRDKSFVDSLFASEQVSCHEIAESPQAERARRGEEAAFVEQARRPPSTPPMGAAGFGFGETPEDVERRCAAAGQIWRSGSDKAGCSGPAASLGIAASVDVEFCAGRACAITIEHAPRTDWSRSSVTLKANLETKYGRPQESSGSVPESCRGERAFVRCLESRQVTLRYTWRWAGGESLEMSVGKPTDAESAAIRLVYRRPDGAANVSAL
jgi:hypothetical protein